MIDRLESDIEEQLAGSHENNLTKYSYVNEGAANYLALINSPHYFGFRREISLLESISEELNSIVGDDVDIIELGPGNGLKAQRMLNLVGGAASYTGIDLSPQLIEEARENLSCARCPTRFINADFTDQNALENALKDHRESNCLIMIMGSTIANEPDIGQFLEKIRTLRQNGQRTFVLIGIELLIGDPQTIQMEYDNEENRHLTVQPLRLAQLDLPGEVIIIFNQTRGRIEEWFNLYDGHRILLSSTLKPTRSEWDEITNNEHWIVKAQAELKSQVLTLLEFS